jgi:Tfp pilus assembly protein PilP
MCRAAALAALVLLVAMPVSGQAPESKPAPQAPASTGQETGKSQPSGGQASAVAQPGAVQSPATTAQGSGTGPATAAAKPSENYSYQPAGRRDPFVSLLGAGAEPAASRKGEGAAGLALNDISVRGVIDSGGTLVAVVQGPDNKTYLVHRGDKFLDGTVQAINRQGLIIIQDVNDPLSLVKQREIRKLLRSLEDANK